MVKKLNWAMAGCCLVMAGAAGGYLITQMTQFTHGQANPAAVREVGSYRDIVKKALPAVVSIESKVKTPKVRQPVRKVPDGVPVPEELRKFLDERPDEGPQQGFGSGVIVDPKGVVLTNHHVVAGAETVEVTLADGRKFTSKDIKSDQKTDLAIVRIDAKAALPFLELGDSDAMEIGDRVLAVGAPFGLTGSVTQGIISGKGRSGLSVNMYEDFLQTDAAINPGNSGGPLINLEGKVVGINSAIRTRSGGFQGVGLAIASNMARTVKDQLLTDGMVRRGYLGVQIKDLIDKEVAERLGLKPDQHGVLVSLVFEQGPAGKAGLKAGDVILTLGGKPVKDSRELQRIVAGLPLGKPVEIVYLRDGKSQTIQATIEEQPKDFGAAQPVAPKAPQQTPQTTSLDKLGVGVTELTPEMARKLGFKETKGVVVTQVERGGRADEAGLHKGVVITKVDKEPVETPEAVKERVEKASLEKGVLLEVQTPQGGLGYVVIKE